MKRFIKEKRFAGDKNLDADGDGVPKWADKDDHDPKVGSSKPKSKGGKVPPQFKKKLTKEVLLKIIKEEMDNIEHGEGRMLDYGEVKSDSDEGEMFRNTLRTLIDHAQSLHDTIQDGDDLPEWCHYKIANAANMVSSVADYIKSDLEDSEEVH